jgi:hypothetical protein
MARLTGNFSFDCGSAARSGSDRDDPLQPVRHVLRECSTGPQLTHAVACALAAFAPARRPNNVLSPMDKPLA